MQRAAVYKTWGSTPIFAEATGPGTGRGPPHFRFVPRASRGLAERVKALYACILFAFGCCASAKTPAPHDWTQSPVVVVSEQVNVSVGESMALIVGRYWYQYVPRFDDQGTRVAIYYPAFVPSGITTYDDLLETTQITLKLGKREFRPESARVLSDEETGSIPTLPAGAAVAWFTFQIPRNLAELRFDVLITHAQPHYRYDGKSVAAYWPWMPNLEPLRQELELLDKNFVVTMEALPGVTLTPLTSNDHVELATPKRWILHPRHAENIAAAVAFDSKEK